MDLRAYRMSRGITQAQFADEFSKVVGTRYTKSTISMIESGKVAPPESMVLYVGTNFYDKAVRTGSDARKTDEWVNMSPTQKKSLKSTISKNWNDKGLTQNERVLAYIEEFGSITSKEAFEMIGVTRLASRISDLTKWGYSFTRKTESADNRYGDKTRFTRYSLEEEDG